MASIVKLLVDDSSFNAKIKGAASAFGAFASQIGGAKGKFESLTKSIQASTMAQQALNAVMAKNPMGAVMTVATAAAEKLVQKLTEVSDEQRKIAEAAEERAAREAHENDTIVNSVSKVITEYEMLRQKWATLSDEHVKSQWITENKNKFKQLGIAVNDVKTAEDVFVNNTQAVCNALMARAKAEAWGELYKEQLKEKIQKDLNPSVENGRVVQQQNPNKRDTTVEKMAGVTSADINFRHVSTTDENGRDLSYTVFQSYKQSALDKINAYRARMAQARVGLEDVNLGLIAGNMAASQQEYESILRGLGVWGGSGSGGGGGRGGRGGGGNSGLSIEEKIANGWEKAFAKSNLKDTKLIEKEYEPSDAFNAVYAAAHQQNESSVGELAKAFKRLNEVEGVTEQEKRPSKQGDSGFKKFTEKMGELGGGLSQVSGGLKQMGIEVPESVDKVIGFIQGLTSVLQGVQTIVSIFSTSAMAANTTALIANTAALVANSAANLIPFAGGGVVHAAGGVVAGNTYSNDMIPAALNAGEVVLNRAQVGNLASQIQGGGMSGMNLSATVTGEQIRLVLNNNGRRTGRGEYLQTNFR